MNQNINSKPWIDQSTGINPFEITSTYIHPGLKFVRFFIPLFKLPLFIITFSLSFLYYILAMMIPIKFISTNLIKINSKISDRIILFLFGNVFISTEPTPLVDTFNDAGEVNTVNPGDIIISNFGSYLNIIWFQMQYSPYFVIPCDSRSVVVYSFFTIIARILSNIPIKSGKKATLEKVIKAAKENCCPIIIFPEGTPTNGSGIIQFTDFGENVDFSNTKFHIICFSHRSFGISPNFTFGNGLSHVYKMLGRTMSSMKVKIALSQDIPRFDSKISSDWIQKVRIVMSKILRVPLLSVSDDDARLYFNLINAESKIHID